MTAKTIMIQGTASDAGKTLFAVALCRIFRNRGFKVAPFKSQNMSLNSFVTSNGKEIARSQVIQALAAKIEPIVEHNPILLKPKGNNKSQIILMGNPYIDYEVGEYYDSIIIELIPAIKRSISFLMENNEIVVIEGAGSPAEINLNDREIANMFVANLVQSPVLLIADIDRGGVFASIYGTLELLKPNEKDLIHGFVINKFRGDIELLIPGIQKIENFVKKKCLGVIPYINNLYLPSEDSLGIKDTNQGGKINIFIIKFPKISNFTDFEPLSWHPDVNLSYIEYPSQIKEPDLIILPGTKNTVSDLNWLKVGGFESLLKTYQEKGVLIIGICGGYQMLGEKIIDHSIEGEFDENYDGLKLLPISTIFKEYQKITKQVIVKITGLANFKGEIIKGYEIHMGEVIFHSPIKSIFNSLEKTNDNISPSIGITNHSQTIIGTFIHGLFENDGFRNKLIDLLLKKKDLKSNSNKKYEFNNKINENLEKLAQIVESNVDIDEILKIMGIES
ncbi:MAG: cobyric acid synthase [Candidatus Odinarchaeota archaeon]